MTGADDRRDDQRRRASPDTRTLGRTMFRDAFAIFTFGILAAPFALAQTEIDRA